MEEIVIAALTLAKPYLSKTGDKIAEKIGEDMWNLLKKPFSKKEKQKLFAEKPIQIEEIKNELVKIIEKDQSFKAELINMISELNPPANNGNQINNYGSGSATIIGNNFGDFKL